MTSEVADPFGTAALRAAVLAAWKASPARFREDANAEEDLALGAYRDRLIVELAQNAADAATRAGAPGRLLLRLHEGRLHAANTGRVLDAAGVQGLSTLRASAKRDELDAVGRFGVGFAAVRAVADEMAVFSRSGGVGWSLETASGEVAALAELAAEVSRRGGHLPVLRLPFPAIGEVLDGYDTTVVLALRDAESVGLARRLLEDVDDALMLALPGLAEIVVEIDGPTPVRRVLRAVRERDVVVVSRDDGRAVRWRTAVAGGALRPELLADRPTEERARPRWSLTWAVPVDTSGAPLRPATSPVVHAPTPTAEQLDLPALLLGTFPLDATRRSIAAGPLRDFLVERAAVLYADLVVRLATESGSADVLDLVPNPMPVGAFDGSLRRAVVSALAEVAFLPAAQATSPWLRPPDGVLVQGADTEVLGVLSEVLPGLIAAPWARRSPVLARLGAEVLMLADVVDALADLDRPPDWWRTLYQALGDADPDALGALPVPLADGRLVRGPRGLLLPDPSLPDGLDLLGLRVVHPDAAFPSLMRLGARPGVPAAVLADPAVRTAIAGSLDADDPDALAEVVLRLVAAVDTDADLPAELAELALRDIDGELAPAGELLLPDGSLAALLEPGALGIVDPAYVRRWGADLLAAVGVLSGFTLVHDTDVPVDPDSADHDLDDEDGWLEDLLDRVPDGAQGAPPLLPELLAVRDLDLVRGQCWSRALEVLAAPPLRSAIVDPALLLLEDGRRLRGPSYSAWWLRRYARLAGQPLSALRDPGADGLLAGLYDDAPDLDVDAAFRGALGLRGTLADLLAEPGGADDLLSRLADLRRPVSAEQLRDLYGALSALDPADVSAPERVRLAPDLVADAVDVAVLDAPDLRALAGERPLLVVPASQASALGELLGLELASAVLDPQVQSSGQVRAVPPVVSRILAAAPRTWVEHEALVVSGRVVDWRVENGAVHAATLDGLARGLAWAAGAWETRLLLAAVLLEPDRLEELLAEAALDQR